MGCRMYLTPEGLKGHPTVEMVGEAVSEAVFLDVAARRRRPS